MNDYDLYINDSWFSGCSAENPKAALDIFKERFWNILGDPNACRDWYVSRRTGDERTRVDPVVATDMRSGRLTEEQKAAAK